MRWNTGLIHSGNDYVLEDSVWNISFLQGAQKGMGAQRDKLQGSMLAKQSLICFLLKLIEALIAVSSPLPEQVMNSWGTRDAVDSHKLQLTVGCLGDMNIKRQQPP